ncbi:MAG: smalltalk protein [Bacteroides sp.]
MEENNDNTTKKKGFSWDLLLKIIIAVASAVAGALGVSACR